MNIYIVREVRCFMKNEIFENLYLEYEDLKALADKLLIEDDLTVDWNLELIEIEENLETYSNFIRVRWQEKVVNQFSKYYKSPPKSQTIYSMWGREIEYGYERSIEYNAFEEDIHKSVSEYSGFTLTYSSAMTAFNSLMIFLNDLFLEKFEISFVGGYFETVYSLELFKKMNNVIHFFKDEDSMLNYSSTTDVLFLEATKYNMLLETTDILHIINNFIKKQNSLAFIIIDTTLMGDSFPFEKLLKNVGKANNIIYINFRSALKMHQQGFEFSNIGLVSLYYSSSLEPLADKLNKKLKSQRSIIGSNLSLLEFGLLDAPFFKESKYFSDNILSNTKYFAEILNSSHGDIIKKVIYPFNSNEYQKTPFIYIILKENSDLFYKAFIKSIKEELQRLNISIYERNSFGFRNISFEYIETVDKNKFRVIKIAPGKIKGVKYHALLDTLIGLSYKEINYE